MKNIIQITLITILTILIGIVTHAQCPSDPSASCTSTISTNTGSAITANAGDVICITGGTQTGAVTVNNGGIIILSGGTVNNQISVQSGGNLVVSGGTLNNSASLPTGAKMFIKNNPTLNNTLAMSGGTLNVLSGGTLSKDISATAASTINNCGTISGTRNFNPNITLNNYSSTALALKYGGNVVNNYAANATISFGTVDVTGGILNNYATGLNFSITSSWNNGVTFNNSASASMTVTSVPGGAMPSSTVFNNAGTLTYSPVLNTTGATFNNAATGTLNFTSSASANKPNITNNGTMNVSGTFYLAGNTTTNNGTMTFSNELRMDGGTLNMGPHSTTTTNTLYKNSGTMNMNDQSVLNIVQNITTWNGTPINLVSGCAAIFGSTTPSTTNINSSLLGNSNLNFCGSAPMQAGGTINTITSVANNGSGAYRITMASGPATNGYIQISGITGVSNLNGYWQVIRINATTFDLVGSTFNSGAVIGSSQVQVDQSKLKLGTSTYLGYGGCTNPCIPLPIKLISFNALKDNGKVFIAWQTSNETNNKSYTVERSSDGIHYQVITVITGNKNSTTVQNYSTYDFTPLEGVSYYRLKQMDYDGSISYSSISVISFETRREWSVYPNPSTDGSITITSDFAEADILTVTVTDVTGNIDRMYTSETYKQKLEVNGLSSGLYVISIQSTSEFVSKKLIVQ